MIQSVERALNIMMCVSDNHGVPVTISEIAKKTKLNTSTCCHIVDTLASKGFLTQVSRSRGYVLGVYAYNLTRYRDFHHDLIITCAPILRWMQAKTSYTTLLANLIEGDKFVLSYAENSANTLKQKGELYKGTLYDSATGRAMLAMLGRNELKSLVEKVGLPTKEEWDNINSFENLASELNKLSNLKVVKVETEGENSYFCKYAVGFSGPKYEKFAIGLDMRKDKKPDIKEEEMVEKVMLTAANEIKRRMQFINE